VAYFTDGRKRFRVENVGRLGKGAFYMVASTPEDGHYHNYGIPLRKGLDSRTPAWRAMCEYFGEQRAKWAAARKKAVR
jgi:hypothetical protein